MFTALMCHACGNSASQSDALEEPDVDGRDEADRDDGDVSMDAGDDETAPDLGEEDAGGEDAGEDAAVDPGESDMPASPAADRILFIGNSYGEAYRTIFEGDNEEAFRSLYAGDGSHPAIRGSYLAACVMFATMTGTSPVGLASGPSALDAAERLALQEIAVAVVFDESAPGNWTR